MKANLPILLAEDDLVDVKTVQRAFKQFHLTNPLHVVANGSEALAFLRRQGKFAEPATAPRPGIILLDLNMPVMNGIEFLQAIKSDGQLRRIPVIVLTSSKEESDLVASYDLSVAGYIVKPVDFGKFLDVVKAIDLYWSLCEVAQSNSSA